MSIWKNNLIYSLKYSICVTFLFSVFICIYIIKRKLWPGDIVFYEGLRIVVYVLFLYIGIAILRHIRVRRKRAKTNFVASFLTFKVLLPALFTYVLLGYSFVITGPSLLDRSISTYVISAVAHSAGEGVDLGTLHTLFIQGYIEGTKTVERRLNEQIITGNIIHNNGSYFITDRGRFTTRMNQMLVNVFNIDDKHVNAKLACKDGNTSYPF